MLIAGILLSVCLTILGGIPIAAGLALVAVATMVITAGPELLVIFIQRAYAATTSFPLLAIPFFILAGNLMNVGGTTERIFAVANLLVGRIRGGLAHVNVIGSIIFAGMSGSAVADAAGLGVIEIRAMVKEGYTARYAATISAVSATIGPIIPPSIPFVIYGSLANVSVGALFLAGIVPLEQEQLVPLLRSPKAGPTTPPLWMRQARLDGSPDRCQIVRLGRSYAVR